jgi:MarR family transcriptional regulator, organic hydroperoxide resistance regulator
MALPESDLDDEREPIPTVDIPASAASGPVSHAMFRVARLHRMHAAQLLRQVGLHPAQELVMMQLWDRGAQRQTDLVRLMGSDAATMTRTIQRLESAGFVRRRPAETDKRVVIVEPTVASFALRANVEAVWAELEERTTGHLTAEQKAGYLGLLGSIEARLSTLPVQPNELENDTDVRIH